MPRKENLFGESGMLQAMASFNKDFSEVAGRVKETNRKYAVTNFLDNLGQMNQPRNFEKMRADLEEATKLAELPQSSDPAVLARAVQESQQKLAAMQQMAALDEMQRQELKDRYVNDNLALISMMNDDEKASLSYAFPKIAGTLAQFSQGNPFARALGGGGGGADWEYKEWETGGMSKIVAFDKKSGTHKVLDQQFDPLMGLKGAKESAEINKIASEIQMNTIKAQELMRNGQLPDVQKVGDRSIKYVDLPAEWNNMSEKDKAAWAKLMALPHGNDFLQYDYTVPGRLGIVVRDRDPGGGGGGLTAYQQLMMQERMMKQVDEGVAGMREANVIKGIADAYVNQYKSGQYKEKKMGMETDGKKLSDQEARQKRFKIRLPGMPVDQDMNWHEVRNWYESYYNQNARKSGYGPTKNSRADAVRNVK